MQLCRAHIGSLILLVSFSVTLTFGRTSPDSLVVQQSSSEFDTVQQRIYPQEEVVVTGLRTTQKAYLAAPSVSIIGPSTIEGAAGNSVADLLSTVSGLHLRSYGSASSLQTLSQRGFGGEHSLVLLNGMRISSLQDGSIDLGSVSLDHVRSVEVIRGGQSAAYGSDAVTGAINILTGSRGRVTGVGASTTRGSFGYSNSTLNVAMMAPSVRIAAGGREERSEEDFPFQFSNGPEVTKLMRKNADLHAWSVWADASYGARENAEIFSFIQHLNADRGVPGPVVSKLSASSARQRDRLTLFQLGYRSTYSDRARLRATGQIAHNYRHYFDPNMLIGSSTVNNFIKNLDLRIDAGYDLSLAGRRRLAFGVEVSTTTAEGNSIRTDVRRTQAAAFVASQIPVLSEGSFVEDFSIYPGLRYDVIFSQKSLETRWSPQIGISILFSLFNLGFVQDVRPVLRSNLSSNFRSPTFNELYFSGAGGIGNPNLRNEESISFDVGGDITFNGIGVHRISASYFRIGMDDKIVWTAAGGASVTPKNLRSVLSYGLELEASWMPIDKIELSMNYTSTQMRKTSKDHPGDQTAGNQLVYVPQEAWKGSISYSERFECAFLKEAGLTVSTSRTGFRYTAEDNMNFLPSYIITNLAARTNCTIDEVALLVKFEVFNLFDADYQIMLGYPMPKRHFRGTVGIQL